jgi:flagellar FliL protein
MTDKTDAAPAPKKGKGLLIKLLGALVLIGAGGGATYAVVQSGMLGNAKSASQSEDHPKLVRKGEDDPYAPKGEGKEGANAADIEGEGGSEYRTSYYNFVEDFTSNLACSTRRDGRVLLWLQKHELAIRSEILIVLADTPEEDVLTPEGKERLQKRLTETINRVLTKTEGFGGVDAVHFKSFLVQ